MVLSDRVKGITPSATLAITARVKQMKKEGVDVIGFGAGEPDFDTPKNVKKAAVQALKEGVTKYTPASGTDELKQAVCDAMKRECGVDYAKENVVVSCGAKHSLYNLFQALCNPGDEVVIPSPYWVSYEEMVKLAGGVPVFAECKFEDEFELKAEAVKAKITPKTRIILVNSPNNPTGAVYEEKELKAIGELAGEHACTIISDEIYDKMVFGKRKNVCVASLGEKIKERTITVNGVSKTYSMTGWRIGWAVGPVNIMKAISNMQSHATSNPTSFAQKASVEALNGKQNFVSKMAREFNKRRKRIVALLNEISGVECPEPNGAFYVFPKVSSFYGSKWGERTINGSLDLAEYLLGEARVGVVPGIAFGSDANVRLSYATSMQNIEEGVKRIKQALEKLKASQA
ncbi:pyridoxal phosphate-dependent aminotransferase [Candidatus Micrarchaeota archaeon]|nr:pyridoxal phosphate-dependent aminotransferase [Candidatus Micrarchaeota archaeon]